jgi:hypothetical protein
LELFRFPCKKRLFLCDLVIQQINAIRHRRKGSL